ncbi:calpain family cysteine protease-like protein [Trypanosoma grayi]|uniref:calpain family cysteine protease-like protein n=1 Tax=Trypanosoma grayi TaxID=71804 RepID=UPI0004F4110D|nr:calpain family cysteine protease-like protein [Trypanosoma grayi]KEG09388.1 calpain family cysteine protease-like protein [Trypanosoma grayi]
MAWCASCCIDPPKYVNGKPTVSGGDIAPVFADGRLFRIVKRKRWYYYNDTQDSEMHVGMKFGGGSVIEALGKTKFRQTGSAGATTATLVIMPLETEPFIEGVPLSWNGTAVARPFSAVEKAKFAQLNRMVVVREMAAVSKVLHLQGGRNNTIDEEKALHLCLKHHIAYVDMNFPPINSSIRHPSDSSTKNIVLRDLDKFSWRRPKDYLPKSWQKRIALYKHGVNPRAIDQGKLGDCWLMCSISALAEHSKSIRSLFLSPHWCCRRWREEKAGAYRVMLNLNGWWRTLVLDDYFPSTSKLPCFGRTREAPCDLWVSLLEKAYAKAYGSYAAISGGAPAYALQDLTGFPTFDFSKMWTAALRNSEAAEVFFKKLHEWRHQNYLITVNTPNSDLRSYLARRRISRDARETEMLFEKAGLALGHAYTVLAVKHFPLHGLCMLKIRNPWANKVEWSGDWSDNSAMWKTYPLIKVICRPEKKADGIFWIEWKDFVRFFEDGCVCFYRPGYHEYRIPGVFHWEIPNVVLEVVVKERFEAWLVLVQKSTRGLHSSDPESKYTGLLINLSCADGTRQKVIRCSAENAEDESERYLFVMGKTVALKYEFMPENSPYYVIPRRMMHSQGDVTDKRYVLALLVKNKIRSSSAEVNLRRLTSNCAVFNSMKVFDLSGVSKVSTTFQYKAAHELPVAKQGSSLHNAKTCS